MRNKKRWTPWLFLWPSLSGVLVFSGIPFLDVLRRSFYTPITKAWVGFDNYIEVWNNQAFRLAASNTLIFMAVAIPMLLVLSFLMALLVYKGDSKHGIYKTTLVLPLAIPVASIVLLWRIFFCVDGLWNQGLSAMTGRVWETDWVHESTAFGVLVATFLWKWAGYDMLLWLAGLSAIPDSHYEAAKVDGAGSFQQMIYITLPEITGTLGMAVILSCVNSFRIYRESYLLAGAYPDESIYMMQHLFNNWFLILDVQKMSTGAIIMSATFLLFLAVPGTIYTIIKRRRVRRHET